MTPLRPDLLATTRQLAPRRSSSTRTAIQTPPSVMLRSTVTSPREAVRLWVMTRSCLMAWSDTPSRLAGITMLWAPVRFLIMLTDTATTLLATTHFSSMLSALQTPLLAITRYGIMTRMPSVWLLTTQQSVPGQDET